uniref:Uncharacterized protein n=1 Tax=Oryza barthii TaxID=65489 RepID=A0A0D3G960_9ORYZ
MEMRPRDLAAVLAMSCLLLLPLLVSSVPVSAAMDVEVNNYPALRANPRHNPKRPPGREMSVQDIVAATTNAEVNDYPAPGANHRHNPKRPPRRE